MENEVPTPADGELKPHPLCLIFRDMEDEEYAALRDSIAEYGQRHAIVLFEGQILDGRHRYKACREVGCTPATRPFNGDYKDAVQLVVDENVTRRHLTTSQRAQAAAKLVTTRHGGDRRSDQGAESHLETTVKDAADKLNVSERSVKAARTVQQFGDEELDGAITDGVISVEDAYRAIKHAGDDPYAKKLVRQAVRDVRTGRTDKVSRSIKHQERSDRHEEARQRVQSQAVDLQGIRVCSCAEMAQHVDAGSLDAIYTDPPYEESALPCWTELAEFAVHALKPGGILLTLSGQMFLPEVLRRLDVEGLTYRWQAALVYQSCQRKYNAVKVTSGWKPLLAFRRVGGPIARYSEDCFRLEGSGTADMEGDRADHEWGQSQVAMEQVAAEWLEPGWKVCDPFVGAGSLLVAARAMDCVVIGCDINAAHVETTRQKLSALEV